MIVGDLIKNGGLKVGAIFQELLIEKYVCLRPICLPVCDRSECPVSAQGAFRCGREPHKAVIRLRKLNGGFSALAVSRCG